MTRPAAGDPDPRGGSPARAALRGASNRIVPLLVVGLVFRLLILYALPGSGFRVDLDAFRFWASDLAANGPYGFYERGFFADYTPGYLYLLWAIGAVGGALGGIGDLIKLPAILADGAIGWLVWSMALEVGASRRRALAAAALYLFFPISWFDSVVWGQVDAVGVLFLLLGVRAIWRERLLEASIWATVAAVVKPQLGILVPILVAWTVGRFLAERRGAARTGAAEPAWRHAIGVFGPPALLALATATALSAPFGITLAGLVERVVSAATGYPYLSVNAYNPWALLSLGGHGIALDGTWVRDIAGPGGEAYLSFGPLAAVHVGTGLLLAAIAAIGLVVVRRPTPTTVLVALAVLALVFFVVPTRVHERYLFPFVPLGAILVARSPRWTLPWLASGIATFLGLYVVLTTLYPENPSISDWLGIGPAIRSQLGVSAIALAHVAVLAWAALRLRPAELARLEADEAATTDEAAAHPAGTPAGSASRPAAVPTRAAATGAARTPAPTATAASTAAGILPDGLLRRLRVRPVHADRSGALIGEGGGRVDRLDLWVVVVLAIALLALRTYRLDQPYGMHFDEVYHARTATEFLQDWRYGEPHQIYEFTHPHLAKYAMAAGLVAFGNDRVVATSELGVPVVAAAAIPRLWVSPAPPSGRSGEWLFVATDRDLRAYDLATRALMTTIPIADVRTLHANDRSGELYAGTGDGRILFGIAGRLDSLRGVDSPLALDPPDEIATVGGPITGIGATDDGAYVGAVVGETLVAVSVLDRSVTGRVTLPGISSIVPAGNGNLPPSVEVKVGPTTDRVAIAAKLAALLGGSADRYPIERDAAYVVFPLPSGVAREPVQAAIADGSLPGARLLSGNEGVVVGTREGIALVDLATASVVGRIATADPVTGIANIPPVSGRTVVSYYAAAGRNLLELRYPEGSDPAEATAGTGVRLPKLTATLPMPGPVRDVAWNEATQMVHVLGSTPAGDPTIYVVEPHANAVYADARLPFEPVAWAADFPPGAFAPASPASARQELLAFSATGAVAAVDAASHSFAWRLPGVVAGVLTALLLYLLSRLLFRRRAVAVLAAIFAGLDGMLYAHSRIGMNDAYVGLFIVAAYALFAGLWTGRWRSPAAFWVLMPATGALLGLALAAKWVALYAIGGIGVLVLARSALGRTILVGGLLAATAVLGYVALSVPPGGTSGGNLAFVLAMIAVTLVATTIAVLRPIAWTLEEVRAAVAGPLLAGVALLLLAIPFASPADPCDPSAAACTSPLVQAAFALVALGGLVALAFRLLGRRGWGPLAPPALAAARGAPPPDPAPDGWLRLGSGFGLPALWLFVSLVAIPLGVYVLSYLPWVELGNRLTEAWPPGNGGQTLADLTASMYGYHNNLRATHAAASPWWAWPFDLKPVWFYQGSFTSGADAVAGGRVAAGDLAGAIYDGGNPVIWWLGVPALAWSAWAAWRRRSLPLALIVIGFLCQWLPWARIDRATFQYHYYTSLPFVLLALAAFTAELWHGASRRTWVAARIAAALAILAPALLWLFRLPLCALVGVAVANKDSEACRLLPPGQILVTTRTAGLLLVLAVAGAVLVLGALRLERDGGRTRPLVAVAAIGSLALALAGRLLDETPLLRIETFLPEIVAVALLVPLGYLARLVIAARDARRFVGGIVVAALGWFVLWYPNLSGLPVPAAFVNPYQGFLPTYLYPFQFPVNTDPPAASPPLASIEFAILAIALLATVATVAYSAAAWRVPVADEEGAPGPRRARP